MREVVRLPTVAILVPALSPMPDRNLVKLFILVMFRCLSPNDGLCTITHPWEASGAAMAMLVAEDACMLMDGSHCGNGPALGGLMRTTTCETVAQIRMSVHPS